MSARTNIQSMTGALLSISAERPVTFDSAGYSDTGIDWTVIGTIETFGNHGMQAQEINFTAIEDAVVQKLKGSKNYGTMSMTLGNIPSDAGQTLLQTLDLCPFVRHQVVYTIVQFSQATDADGRHHRQHHDHAAEADCQFGADLHVLECLHVVPFG